MVAHDRSAELQSCLAEGSFGVVPQTHFGIGVFEVGGYGVGTEVFHDQEIENVQIPKTIAKMMGQTLFPATDGEWPPLN